MIVQLYAVEDYDRINAVYPVKKLAVYKSISFRMKKGRRWKLRLSRRKGVWGIYGSCILLGNNYFVDLADEYGLNLFIHVADREEDVWRLSRRGIYGYYSDFLKPNEAHTNGEN